MGEFLAIAVAHDGASQEGDGKAQDDGNHHGESVTRPELEEMLQLLLQCEHTGHIPATLCFYTEGVRWLRRESPVIETLKTLSKRGVKIVACRACMAQAGLIAEMTIGQLETEDHVDEILRHAEHTMVL